jgi:hypothetical protein
MQALVPIKDNLQEYRIKSRYYWTNGGSVSGASVSLSAIVYYAPITSDPDFRDVDTVDYTVQILDGVTPLTPFAVPAFSTYTADDSTDILTVGADIPTGTPIYLKATALAPAPLRANRCYYAINIDTTTIKVAETYADAIATTAIDLTDAGTGTNTFAAIEPAAGEYFIDSVTGAFVFNTAEVSKTLSLTYNYTMF